VLDKEEIIYAELPMTQLAESRVSIFFLFRPGGKNAYEELPVGL
jgi:hypothetical protein